MNTILSTSKSSELQCRFKVNGLETSDISLEAHKFNEYFASVGSNLSANFDEEYRSDNYLNTLGKRLENDFFFTLVTVNYVITILDSMKNSAPGCDKIPIAFYQEYKVQLGAIIYKI